MSDRVTIQMRSSIDFKEMIERQAAKRNVTVSSHVRLMAEDYERLNNIDATLVGIDQKTGKQVFTVEEMI